MKKFREFLTEVSHGEHKETEYEKIDSELVLQLARILEGISNKKTLVRFAYNCAKDVNFDGRFNKELFLINNWLNGEETNRRTIERVADKFFTGESINLTIGNALYCTAFAANGNMGLSQTRMLAEETAFNAANAFAEQNGNPWTYSATMRYYIAIAKGLQVSSSQYKSKTISEIDPDKEDFIERLAVMFDEMENNTLNDEEPLFIQASNEKCLNLPKFTPPISVCGQDNMDLAEKIYNSRYKHSLFNYISHIHK